MEQLAQVREKAAGIDATYKVNADNQLGLALA